LSRPANHNDSHQDTRIKERQPYLNKTQSPGLVTALKKSVTVPSLPKPDTKESEEILHKLPQLALSEISQPRQTATQTNGVTSPAIQQQPAPSVNIEDIDSIEFIRSTPSIRNQQEIPDDTDQVNGSGDQVEEGDDNDDDDDDDDDENGNHQFEREKEIWATLLKKYDIPETNDFNNIVELLASAPSILQIEEEDLIKAWEEFQEKVSYLSY
jgi:hypothetical protein